MLRSIKDQKVIITELRSVAKATKKQRLPLFSSQPAAGFPAPGDDMVERPLDLNDLLIDHPESTFYVRVSGDSMEGAGIFSGDILIVDRRVEPSDGSIVVAAVYGELVVKRLVGSASNGYQLISEREGYPPLKVNSNEDCVIWGIVIGSVRIFNKK